MKWGRRRVGNKIIEGTTTHKAIVYKKTVLEEVDLNRYGMPVMLMSHPIFDKMIPIRWKYQLMNNN